MLQLQTSLHLKNTAAYIRFEWRLLGAHPVTRGRVETQHVKHGGLSGQGPVCLSGEPESGEVYWKIDLLASVLTLYFVRAYRYAIAL